MVPVSLKRSGFPEESEYIDLNVLQQSGRSGFLG